MADKVKERQIERRIVAPDLPPAGRLQEGLFGQTAFRPVIEHRLNRAGEHLEADRQIRAIALQSRQHVQLPAMMVAIGVRLAQEHDVLAGQVRHQPFE